MTQGIAQRVIDELRAGRNDVLEAGRLDGAHRMHEALSAEARRVLAEMRSKQRAYARQAPGAYETHGAAVSAIERLEQFCRDLGLDIEQESEHEDR
jgi:hypothetical protein